jgi:outer membrane protein assembly factor BamB
MPRSFILTLALFSLMALDASASDWPNYRGEKMDGVVTETGLLTNWPAEGLKKIWSVPVEGKGTHAGPAVVSGKVFLPGRSGTKDTLCCFDASTGKPIWKQEYDAPGNLSYGAGSRATPVVSSGSVFTLNGFGKLACWDAESGAKTWERDLVADFKGNVPNFGIAAAPLIDGERVICEPGGPDAAVVALDRKTGKELWRAGSGACSYAPPQLVTFAGVKQLLCYPVYGLLALNPTDGKELWKFPFNDNKNIPMPIVKGDLIHVSDNNNGFATLRVSHAAEKWNVERLWGNAADKAHTSSPVAADDALYFFEWFASEGKIKCIDPKDGHLLWSTAYPGEDLNASLLLLDAQHLLVNFNNGDLALLEVSPKAFKQLANFKATAPGSFAPAAISNGRLYLRDSAALTCYDLKGR